MKKSLKLIKEIGYILLSFFIPFIVLIILFNANKLALNGYHDNTIMMIDMQSEYIAYIRDLKHILTTGESLIYTNEKALGGDYLSIFTFYLSSPFNFFVIFFKDEALPLFFAWSSIIKMAFASVNFYLLTRFTSKFTYQKIIFAIGYGLVSYSFIYMSNYMWLDGVMILPLVALGINFLKEKKHYWLYPLAIGYSLMTSWYIGFMICVFAVLYFLYIFVSKFEKENGEFYKFIIRFALFSLIGGLISSTYWLTAFLHLSGTKAFTEIPNSYFFSFSMLFSGFLENNYAEPGLIRQYHSYISMFVGMVPLVFCITYFFNKEFSWKERLSLLALLVFYLAFSMHSVTTALLHGGKEPTWFPGRYSFIIGFIVCYIASKSADEAHKLHPLYYGVPLLMGIIVYIIVTKTTHSERLAVYPISGPSAIMYFLTIGVGLLISILYQFDFNNKLGVFLKKALPHAITLLLFVQVASVYRGGDKVFKENNNKHQYQTYTEYLEDNRYTSSFNLIKKYDKETYNSPFYRMESTFNRPGNYNQIDNNPMFYSYNGVSNFSSSSKKDVESYLGRLGFHYNSFFTKYEGGSTYAINSLLGIKYLLEDKSSSENIHPYFLEYDTFNKLALEDTNNIDFYYNKNAINLGFASDKSASWYVNEGNKAESGNTYWFDHFEYQNQIFKEINNSINEDIYKPLTVKSITTSIIFDTDEFGLRTYKNVKEGNIIEISYETPTEGYDFPKYFSEKTYFSGASFYLDNRLMPINTYWNKGIFSIKESTNHKHTLRIRFSQNYEEIKIRPELYYEDLNVLNSYLTQMKNNEFTIDKINNSLTKKSYQGHLAINSQANKDLIFTLPNEKGISVYIDSKKVKVNTRFNIFTSVDISNLKEGNHKVTIEYQDKGLVAALPLFFITITGFVPLIIFYNKIEDLLFKKRKEEQ